jgi:hypothetical protein
MMFSSYLMAIRRKEDKRARIACQVMDMNADGTPRTGETRVMIANGMPLDGSSHPYGDPTGISLPSLTGRVVQGMRRKGISPKQDYSRVRAQVTPSYSIGRFVEDLQKSTTVSGKTK